MLVSYVVGDCGVVVGGDVGYGGGCVINGVICYGCSCC